MCLAPEVDLIAGLAITAVGIDTLRRVDRKPELVIGSLPLLFGLHTLVETFVWWSVDGTIDQADGRAAMWMYLLFALPGLPMLVPLSLLLVESERKRRDAMMVTLGLGTLVAAMLTWQLLDGTVDAIARPVHIEYNFGLDWPILVVAGYLVATCAPLIISSWPTIRWWGIANVIVVAVIGAAAVGDVISLWCFWAAATSIAINLTLRRHRHDRRTDAPIAPTLHHGVS